MLALFGMFLLALTPIIWLVVALCGLHIEAYKASIGSLIVAIVVSFIGWQMSPVNIATAALEGFAMALWPITIVIIAAVFTYNVTVHTAGIETIKTMLCSVSSDKRVLVLLIGWCFGAFLEGMAGFGTAVAIPASMLMAVGLGPVEAILSCLIANTVPTMFGSIGIPTTTLASITGIDPITLATTQTLQAAPFIIACPILIVMLVGGGPKGLKGVLPITLLAGVSMAVAEYVGAMSVGPTLAVIIGSVVALLAVFAFALTKRGQEVPAEYRLPNPSHAEGLGAPIMQIVLAWSPFILIFVVLLLTSKLFPAIYAPLSSIKSTVNIYTGDPTATLTFTWIDTPGVLIMICGIIGGIIQGCSFREMLQVLRDTCVQMSKTVVTMLGVLAVAKIMGYSGMIASIAAFFVGALGGFYPLVAPLLGALGTFVTGSGTSSEVLFGAVQQHAAETLGVNQTWLVAANSLGTSAGKALSPQNIAIGCAACGLAGRDGEILGKIAKYAFGFAACMAVLIYVGSLFIA